MDSSSKSLAEDLGSDKHWEKGRAANDFYQRSGHSLTRFVLSNVIKTVRYYPFALFSVVTGACHCVQLASKIRFSVRGGELSEKQLHLLRHPKTGNATLYAIGNERVEELLKFDDGLRSVLLGDNVIRDGSMILLAPVNPVLLLLPYLRKYAKDDYVSLKNILVDDNFPSIKLLENVKTVKSSLKHACHCKEFDFDHAVSGILEENLPTDILSMVEMDFVGLEDKDAQSNKRLHQDSKISEKSNAVKVDFQDSLADTVPRKRMCLKRGEEFYACYEDDAVFIANNVFCSEVGLRRCKVGKEQIFLNSVNGGTDFERRSETELMYHVLNNTQYLRVIHDAILVQHYRVEVYAANDGQWELKAKGSLGCLSDFEEIVGDSIELHELTTVAALTVTEGHDPTECLVSIVSCNVREMQFTIAEFLDTEHFVNLERCLAALVPRQCLLFSNKAGISSVSLSGENSNQLNTALRKAGIRKEFFEISEQLSATLSDVHLSRAQKTCLVGLIQHLHLNDDGMKSGKFQLRNYKSAGYMYLNSAAVKALELFSACQEDEDLMDDVGSLFELLNKCCTPQGQRLLRDWVRRPLHDIRKINERLDVVEAFVNDSSCRVVLHDDILRRIPDITVITRKLVQKKAGLQECYRLYQIIRLLKRFHQVLNELHGSCGPLAPSVNDLCLEPLVLAQLQFEKFMALIETTIDIVYFQKNGLYRILPDIDENLLAAAEGMCEIEKKCNVLLKKVCSGITETVKLENNEHHGFHFRVTLKAEKSIRQSGMRILETSKGSGVRFTSDSLDALNREYLKLSSHYEAIQSSFIDMVVETCSGYVSTFCELSEAVAVIDVLVALSVLAAGSPFGYVRPQIINDGKQIMELRKCRHPVMEANPNSSQFISNDVVLGSEEGDNAMFLILTGANMGGKSTYLRSCALSVLLAQMGSFVPCESARFSLIDGIHTRIGSCDYQCKGVSTFMAEMNDCASILESATCHSLVIVDELGRGTSTYDGFGLAWAIAEDIVSRVKCFCIYATHYHELTELGLIYPKQLKNVCTASQIDENGQLILLYKIIPGVAGRSFGLNIAKMIGLPENVLQAASGMLEKLESRNSKLPSDEEELYRKMQNSGDDELRQQLLQSLLSEEGD
uniref:DNA mismatch repair proteins mutS family domain-containing protein n=1 Tax=Setaria digitata TaxID=48799 RepID=A0A915PWH6_9BILA